MTVDLYDFDKTVYPRDSASHFWLFCLVRCPWILLYCPVQFLLLILWGVRLLSTGRFKGLFFGFVALIPTERMVKRFWDRHEREIYDWFLPENRARPAVVLSASPDYLLTEICRRLEVAHLICTPGDIRTGCLTGPNCKGAEKVRRLKEELPDIQVDTAYSDNLASDAPMLALARRRIHTVNGRQTELED